MEIKWTDAQESAIDASGRTILVSAAAGSGKTATLTEKIIRALKNRSSLSKMLIVTFTRASTADMREKISKALSRAIAENPSDAHLYNQMVMLGSASISTIDAFCMKPVKDNFAECQLPASFRIADAAELNPITEKVFKETVDKFFLKYSLNRGDGLFDILDGNDFADLVDSLSAAKADDNIQKSMLSLYSSLLNYADGIEIIKKEAEALYLAADNRNIFLCPHGKAILTFLDEFVKSAVPFYINSMEVLQKDSIASGSYYVTFAKDFKVITELEALLREERPYSDFVAFFEEAKITNLIAYKPGPAPEGIAAIKEVRSIYTQEFKKFMKDFFSTPEDELYSDMRRTARMCEVIYDFLKTYDEALLTEKRERGIVDFNDNKRMLYSLLYDQNGNLTPLAKDYESKYDLVLIDEYQDVDEIQDKIFAAIGTDHRFMVGDIKQSIYGFRGADPKVFGRYRKELPELNAKGFCGNGNSIFMSENFRCNEPVIETSNAVCSHIFRACPDSIGYTSDDDLRFSKKLDYSDYNVPKVQVDIITGGGSSDSEDMPDEANETPSELPAEAVNLANRVAELLRGEYYIEHEDADGVVRHNKRITPSDITILVRKRSAIPDVKAALIAMNIPTEAAEIEVAEARSDLLHSPEMIYLLNLLRVINNPANDIALLEILGKAPVCGTFDLEEIVKLRNIDGGSRMRGLYFTIKSYAETNEDDIASKCRLFTKWLDGLRELSVTHSAEELLQVIKADKFCYCGDSDAFLYIYEKARSYRQASFVSLYNFLNYFERHIATEKASVSVTPSTGCVSIMTMHNSKGLEFPVCFIYNCGQGFSSQSIKGDLLFTRSLGASMMLFGRTGKTGEGIKKDTMLRNIAKRVISASEREAEMQNLYVAMTRAREYLFISAKPSMTSMNNVGFDAGDRFRTLYCNSYSPWILTGLQKFDGADKYCDIKHIDGDIVRPDAPLTQDYGTKPVSKEDESFTQHYRDLAVMPKVVTNEQKFLRSLPTKAPASRLADDMLDKYVFSDDTPPSTNDLGLQTDEEAGFSFDDTGLDYRARESILEALRLMKTSDSSDFNRLLDQNTNPTAAQKGTLAHAFLQFCDFEKFININADSDIEAMVREEISRLSLLGFIDAESSEILDVTSLAAFFRSEFFKHVKAAQGYRRELRFNRFVPLAALTKNPRIAKIVGDKTLYVQGSIDLTVHTTDGGIILCDYKTDRLTDTERKNPDLLKANMKRKHSAQLDQYSKAIYDLYGKYPEKIYIYSLPLGEAIEM